MNKKDNLAAEVKALGRKMRCLDASLLPLEEIVSAALVLQSRVEVQVAQLRGLLPLIKATANDEKYGLFEEAVKCLAKGTDDFKKSFEHMSSVYERIKSLGEETKRNMQEDHHGNHPANRQ